MNIEKEVAEFVATIKKGPFKKYVQNRENINWEEDQMYTDALYQGYLDACRTFKWKKDGKDNKKDIRRILEEKEIVGDMKGCLSGEKKENFDEIHKKLCDNFIQKCQQRTNMTYGQAQKIINMAFKYLYCCEHDSEMEERFKACHMPLDSFSLEWFKRCVKSEDFLEIKKRMQLSEKLFTKGENLKSDSIGSWSSMKSWEEDKRGGKFPYEFYRDVIKEYCRKKEEESIFPLQLDFIVWSRMQKIMAAEDFIKAFKDEDRKITKKSEEYDIDNLETTLENRLKEIRAIICN